MKTKISYLIFFVGLVISNSVVSQFPRTNHLLNPFTKEDLLSHVHYLASDKLEGRETGTDGYKLAAIYVDSIFQNANLKKICNEENGFESFFQNVTIEKLIVDKQTKTTLITSEAQDEFILGNNFILFHFGKLKNESLKGEVVFVGDGIYEPDFHIDDFKNKSIKNKWILINENISKESLYKLPQRIQSQYKDIHTSSLIRSEIAVEKGAIGILLLPSEIGNKYWAVREQSFREYYTLPGIKSPYRSSEVPILMIDSTMFKTISSCHSSCELSLEKYLQKDKTINSKNIIGMVNGTQKNNGDIIIIAAHLDHEGKKDGEIYNGADDNASGIAALLEISKVISKNPCQSNIVFAAFTAEEIGALGSYYFINNFSRKNEKIRAMINLDMIGRVDGDANELAIISPNFPKSKLLEIANNAREECKIDWNYSENFIRKNSGDHFPFAIKNIPCVMLFSGFHTDYHQTTDDLEKIDFTFLYDKTKFAYRLLKELDE